MCVTVTFFNYEILVVKISNFRSLYSAINHQNDKNQNYLYYEKFKTVTLLNNSLKKQSKSTTYLFATFIEPKNSSKIVTVNAITAGYGNRVYQVVDGLINSLLTDRICLIDFHTNGPSELIDLPSVTDFNIYEPFVWDLHQGLTQAYNPYKNASRLMQTELPEKYDIIKTSGYPHFFEVCSNPKYFQKLLDKGAVSKSTIDRAMDIENKTNDEQLNRLFQVGFEAANFVLKKAWPLRPHLIALVDHYKTQYFSDSFVIGLQLRSQYVNISDKDVEKFVDCALDIESKLQTKKTVKWFVVSDINIKYIDDKMAKLAPNKIMFRTNGTAAHNMGNENTERAVKALLDIEILSLCDEIIQTGGSTFGFISVLKSLKLPYYVNGTKQCGDRCKNMKSCEKMTLAKPHIRQDINAAVYRKK